MNRFDYGHGVIELADAGYLQKGMRIGRDFLVPVVPAGSIETRIGKL